MTIKLWHYHIKKGLDKLASNDKPNFVPEEIDQFIEKAIYAWLREHTQMAELNETIRQKLSTITVQAPIDQAAIVPTSNSNGVYEFSSASLESSLYSILSLRANISKTNCTSKTISVKLVQYDDLSYELSGVNGPSFKWGHALAAYGKDSSGNKAVFVYTNEDFTVDSLEITYIKHPIIPTFGGYNDIDGSPVSQVETDLPDEVHFELINKTIDLMAISINDPAVNLYSSQYQLNK